jgi:hypothetical protein
MHFYIAIILSMIYIEAQVVEVPKRLNIPMRSNHSPDEGFTQYWSEGQAAPVEEDHSGFQSLMSEPSGSEDVSPTELFKPKPVFPTNAGTGAPESMAMQDRVRFPGVRICTPPVVRASGSLGLDRLELKGVLLVGLGLWLALHIEAAMIILVIHAICH